MVPNTQHNNVSKGLLTFSGIIEVLDCIPINIPCLQYSTVYRNSWRGIMYFGVLYIQFVSVVMALPSHKIASCVNISIKLNSLALKFISEHVWPTLCYNRFNLLVNLFIVLNYTLLTRSWPKLMHLLMEITSQLLGASILVEIVSWQCKSRTL